ncbi:MAG: hypothetical protein WA584_01270 [Pyrinomonadaceae bacterium]
MGQEVDTTTVIQNNTTAIIDGMNANSGALGLEPVPQGTPAAQVEQKYNGIILKKLQAEWKNEFPDADDFKDEYVLGFLQATGTIQTGMPVPCALQLIEQKINDWNLDAKPGFSQNVVDNIVSDLVNSGGITTVSTGSEVESGSQTTNWLCVSTEFTSGSGNNQILLVGYAFTAATVISL